MKKQILTYSWLKVVWLLVLVAGVSLVSRAEMVSGINYTVTNSYPYTVEVSALPSGNYSGDIVIPETVTIEVHYYGEFWTVNATVTGIGESAFYGSSITSISLPSTLQYIGESAFSNCISLTSIDIPNSVTSLGWNAFYYCTNLTSVNIPSGVTELYGTFKGCSSLTEVTIPAAVRYLDEAFKDCTGLTSVVIPSTVVDMGSRSFYGCDNLTSVTCEAANPPYCAALDCFSAPVYSNAQLRVPGESVPYYSTAYMWSQFTHIIGATQKGDVDGDGKVTISDVTTLINYLLKGTASGVAGADVDADGKVTISDVTTLINYLLSGHWPGDNPTEPQETEDDWVDLGLPSGTIWATRNVGADTPEDYGDYFAWGEIVPNKDYYFWSTYKWCKGSESTLTKYCTDSSYGYKGFVDNKTELDPEDDVAYVYWGPSWRMPTEAQLFELVEKCDWRWTAVNGVSGCLVIGPNGNRMFLPAAGSYLYGNLGYSYGYYWSRTNCGNPIPYDAYVLLFDSDNVEYKGIFRDEGLTVRAVRVSQN